jgi:DNA-directed RNA polymerase subunit RPC12/RpoP
MLNLSTPVCSERVRGFQPPWRTVFVYRCGTCNKETKVYANSFRGKTAVPSVGAIRCPHCNKD